jgi:ADP-heptose:LPS heptosyltransferase
MVIFLQGLGDLVLITESIKALRAHYADQPFVLVCADGTQDYARMYLQPDRILAFERSRLARNIFYRMSVIRAIAQEHSAVAIQPAFNRFYLVEDSLIRATGAGTRIGSAGSDLFITPQQRARSDRWYTRLIAQPAQAMHDLTRNALLVAALTDNRAVEALPRLATPPRHPSAPADDYFVVALDASTPIRTWPAEKFAAVLTAVATQSGLRPVIVGDKPAGQPLTDLQAVDLTGKTGLEALIRLVAHARLVIANDSGPVHLAIALGIPVVAVCGGGLPVRYLPYPASLLAGDRLRVATVDHAPWSCFGCGWRCVLTSDTTRAAPCIAGIEVEQVVAEALAMTGNIRFA